MKRRKFDEIAIWAVDHCRQFGMDRTCEVLMSSYTQGGLTAKQFTRLCDIVQWKYNSAQSD